MVGSSVFLTIAFFHEFIINFEEISLAYFILCISVFRSALDVMRYSFELSRILSHTMAIVTKFSFLSRLSFVFLGDYEFTHSNTITRRISYFFLSVKFLSFY